AHAPGPRRPILRTTRSDRRPLIPRHRKAPPMLDATLTSQLKTYLEKVVHPIELVASIDDGPKSAELIELLDEIAALSDRVSVSRTGDDVRRPSFAIVRSGT